QGEGNGKHDGAARHGGVLGHHLKCVKCEAACRECRGVRWGCQRGLCAVVCQGDSSAAIAEGKEKAATRVAAHPCCAWGQHQSRCCPPYKPDSRRATQEPAPSVPRQRYGKLCLEPWAERDSACHPAAVFIVENGYAGYNSRGADRSLECRLAERLGP